MNPFTQNQPLNCASRLLVAGLCSLMIWCTEDGLSGGIAHEVLKALLLGSFSVVAGVFLLPILVRGDWVQRSLALVLLALPGVALAEALFTAYELR